MKKATKEFKISPIDYLKANLEDKTRDLKNEETQLEEERRVATKELFKRIRKSDPYKRAFNYALSDYRSMQIEKYYKNNRTIDVSNSTRCQIVDVKEIMSSLILELSPEIASKKVAEIPFSKITTAEELDMLKEDVKHLIYTVYEYAEEGRKSITTILFNKLKESVANIDIDATKSLTEIELFEGVGEKVPTRIVRVAKKRLLPKDKELEDGLLFWIRKQYTLRFSEMLMKGEIELTPSLTELKGKNTIVQNSDTINDGLLVACGLDKSIVKVFKNVYEDVKKYKESYESTCGTPLQAIWRYFGTRKNMLNNFSENINNIMGNTKKGSFIEENNELEQDGLEV